MTTDPQQFPVSMRFFHWLMAAMVLTMLGIGVAMVASLADYHLLVSIHRRRKRRQGAEAPVHEPDHH